MSFFYGEYSVSMDAKGRIMLPADFRKELPEGDDAWFVLKEGNEGCIAMYTKSQWMEQERELQQLVKSDPDAVDYIRLFLSGISRVEVDSAGRILIPRLLQDCAGLKKEVIFFMQGFQVEIWDKTRKDEYIKANKARQAELAKELFKRK